MKGAGKGVKPGEAAKSKIAELGDRGKWYCRRSIRRGSSGSGTSSADGLHAEVRSDLNSSSSNCVARYSTYSGTFNYWSGLLVELGGGLTLRPAKHEPRLLPPRSSGGVFFSKMNARGPF